MPAAWAEDADADWAHPHRDRLVRAHQECLEIGAAAALRAGRARRAVELAEDAVVAAPLREPAHLLLITSLAQSGDQAAALAAYRRLRKRLAEDLGIDPSAEAEQLHARLLRGGQKALDPATRGTADRHRSRPARITRTARRRVRCVGGYGDRRAAPAGGRRAHQPRSAWLRHLPRSRRGDRP
ncbi:MAG: hypothetical protein GEU86_21785 [Actinophytocola sp.]|nr:hypothetical protein [Actinophytocola sp.]